MDAGAPIAKPIERLQVAGWNDLALFNTQVPPLLLHVARGTVLCPVNVQATGGSASPDFIVPFCYPEGSLPPPAAALIENAWVSGAGPWGRLYIPHPGLWRIGAMISATHSALVDFAVVDAPEEAYARFLTDGLRSGNATAIESVLAPAGSATVFTPATLMLLQPTSIMLSGTGATGMTWRWATTPTICGRFTNQSPVILQGPSLPLASLILNNSGASPATINAVAFGPRRG